MIQNCRESPGDVPKTFKLCLKVFTSTSLNMFFRDLTHKEAILRQQESGGMAALATLRAKALNLLAGLFRLFGGPKFVYVFFRAHCRGSRTSFGGDCPETMTGQWPKSLCLWGSCLRGKTKHSKYHPRNHGTAPSVQVKPRTIREGRNKLWKVLARRS